MNQTKTRTLVFALALAGLTSAGCFSRLHMSKNYGRSYKTAFQRQAVNPAAGATAKTPKGLDALESTIVVDTYRKGLGPSAEASSGNQMILLSPNTGAPGASSPPAR